MDDPAQPGSGFSLACLCAAWCRTCDGYRAVFDGVVAEFEAGMPGLRRRWIDIEDEADLLGEVDVETFPTIVVIGPDGLRFLGPLTPQPETLRRLLRATLAAGLAAGPAPPADFGVAAFVQRLRAGG